MNLRDTVAVMFPHGVVTQSIADNNSFFEVHKNPGNCVPQNCALLASGAFQYARDQDPTGSLLVQAEDYVFFIRVHSTRSGGGHADVALRYGFDSVNRRRVH
jgi:hypothetical protein